jgi:uncharacterized protein GlcG (DUF336 family)
MRFVRTAAAIVGLAALVICADASAQFLDVKILSLEGAKKAAAAAAAEAKRNNWNVAIAVVDEHGQLIYLERLDDTQSVGVDFAIGKARTAAIYRRTTKAMEDTVAGGRNVVLTFPNAVPVEGGVPIVVNGKVIGAIGVSGVTAPQDAQVATAGVNALK